MLRRLGELIDKVAPGAKFSGRSAEVKGITCDSRQVRPGYVFVAVTGTRDDGRRFVEDAVQRGAVAVVAEGELPAIPGVPVVRVADARAALADLSARHHGDPTTRLNVVGVTGTKGKTTTSYLVKSVLDAAGDRAGLIGTIQVVVGGRIMPSPLTTPPADELQRTFAEMAAAGCRSAAMEVSSIALHQRRTRSLNFAGAVFTNLTRDHLDYHGTPEAYREAKGILFEQLSPRAVAAINADDPAAPHYAGLVKGRCVKYGLHEGAEVRGVVEEMTYQGLLLRIHLGAEVLQVRSRLVGRHNAYNLLGAAAVTWAMGYNFEHIKAGLEAMTAVPGRLEAVAAGQPFTVLVDYAHTEDSLRNVLGALKHLRGDKAGRILLVFGCGGDRDRGKRPLMGRAAEELSDFFIVTSDNPRTEEPRAIIKEIEAGISNPSKYLAEPDREQAIRIALGMAREGDVVLIAGKGHETYQVVGADARPFDDRLVARDILKGLEAAKARG